MILADTSVWIDHLRNGNHWLSQLLEANQIVMHPMIIGELASGNLRNRSALLELWEQLPKSEVASHQEVMYAIEHHQWMGKGIGFIDAHLLASSLLGANTKFWTQDKRLDALAKAHGIANNAS